MIRFQADNDLNGLIVSSTIRREPSIDFRTALAARLDGLSDDQVLELASMDGRILVTHDKRTMPGHLRDFLRSGRNSPGVLLVIPQDAGLREVVDTLVLIWADDHPEDWRNAVTVIPFGLP